MFRSEMSYHLTILAIIVLDFYPKSKCFSFPWVNGLSIHSSAFAVNEFIPFAILKFEIIHVIHLLSVLMHNASINFMSYHKVKPSSRILGLFLSCPPFLTFLNGSVRVKRECTTLCDFKFQYKVIKC